MEDKRREELRKIRDELIVFKESPLYSYRIENKNFPVIGEGSHYANIMFIGEAPGKNEAETGHPFCGRSGKVLDTLLSSVSISREDVYVTNIVKDRPPGNRDPYPEEIDLYAPFLDRQIEIIKPKIIATLGRFSMVYILERFNSNESKKSISELHGKIIEVEATYGIIKIIPLYHPAVAVYNSNMIHTLKKDFEILKTST